MNKLKLTSLLIILVLGITSIHAQDSEAAVAITLERGVCFGTCPVYTVTIFEDGTVTYEGESSVTVTGEQTSEIDPVTVQMMVTAFAETGYFDWDENYMTQTISDLPTIITSVTRNGETHRIERYTGDYTAPLALSFLENWIDEMVNTQLWTGVQPDPATISNGVDMPLITLQRDACFGACPVYNVALFGDGIIVYTGIAHVDEIGVRVFETDALAVTSILQQAQSFGYFDWQDSYQEQVITDQPTTITFIRWEDQAKRITRYDGDPNAPLGLVWIEESIDQLISSSAG